MVKKTIKKSDHVLLEQLDHIARGLGETLSPFCEVVVHDLTHPKNAIMAIYNNLSERHVGEPATELGLARIENRNFPQVIANYANAFRDGRRVKSTSIGIRGADGDYIAALCLNIDLTLFNNVQSAIHEFTKADAQQTPTESLSPTNVDALHGMIDQFAARRSTTPRSLKPDERRALVKELKTAGFMDMRRAADAVSAYVGVSRSTIYVDAQLTAPLSTKGGASS